MKKNPSKPPRKSSPAKTEDRTPLMQTLTRFWVALFLVSAIVYIAILFVGGTEGFRSLLSDHVEGRYGLAIDIESSSLSPGLQLTLEGIRMADDTESGDLRIAEARIQCSPLSWIRGRGMVRSVSIHGGTLIFERNAKTAAWSPVAFHRINDLLAPWLALNRLEGRMPDAGAGSFLEPTIRDTEPDDAAAVQDWLAGLPPQWRLALDGLNLAWREGAGAVVASLDNIQLDCQLSHLLDETVVRYRIAVGTARRGSDVIASGVRLEGMRVGDREVGLSFQGDGSGLAIQSPATGLSAESQRALDLMNQFEALRSQPLPEGVEDRRAVPATAD